jgi:hypothetical protein
MPSSEWIQTLKEMGPSKLLLGEERERIRFAADNLIFSRDLAQDALAREGMADIERLCRALADSGRWEHAAAMRLANDVSHAGPACSLTSGPLDSQGRRYDRRCSLGPTAVAHRTGRRQA